MSEILNFSNDKYFIKIKEQVERKTMYNNKQKIVFNALKTQYFIKNEAATKALLEVLDQEDQTIDAPNPVKNVTEKVEVVKQKREPVVAMKDESVPGLGHRLVQNGEYQRAIDLYLSDENIKKYGAHARSVAKRWLEDKKELVANSIFEYLKKNPEEAEIFAECAKVLGKEQEGLARETILQWAHKITRIKHVNDYCIVEEEHEELPQKPEYFGRTKKLFGTTPKQTPKKQSSVDTPICYRLISGMEILGGCNNAMKNLYDVRVNASSRTRGSGNLNHMMRIIYERCLA